MPFSAAMRASVGLILSVSFLATAAEGIGGPVLGFAPDSTALTVRPILGMPGAAVLGDPIPLPSGIVQVFAPPRGEYLLALTEDNIAVARIGLDAHEVTLTPLDVVPHAASLAAFSPDGRSVALYDASAAAIRVLKGLPDAANLDRTVDVSGLPSTVRSLALSSDGTLAAGSADDQSGGVFIFDSDGTAVMALACGNPAALAFLPGNDDLLVADSAANRVSLVRGPGQPGVTPLAGADDGIAAPSAIAASSDGRRAFVLNAGGHVAILDLNGGPVMPLDCNCSPAGFSPLNGDAVFRLTDASTAPVWLLDAGASIPRVVFVPEARASGALP